MIARTSSPKSVKCLLPQDFSTTNSAGLQALIDATGGNQTWDFSGLTFESNVGGTFVILPMPADVPGANEPEFANATHVAAVALSEGGGTDPDSTLYTYQAITDEGVFSIGAFFSSKTDLDGDGMVPDEGKFTYDPPLQQTAFPQTFGTTWSTTTSQTFTVGGFGFSSNLTSEYVVDGFGTLITPAGSAECLRVRNTLSVTNFGFTIITTSYTFQTKEGLAASISINPITNTPASAGYTVRTTGGGGGTAVEQIGLDIPDGLRIEGNYPNPFTASTTIRYDLPDAAHVRLGVYDVMGREVAVPVDQFQTPGQYAADFNAVGLPSGTYLYRLVANGHVQTRTLHLVK